MATATLSRNLTESYPVQSVSSRKRLVILWLMYSAVIIILGSALIDGWSYYTTPYAERPHHEDYRTLRPAGSRGLVFGIVGASMMILMLVYSIQKRRQIFGRRAQLRIFLDLHIFLGVCGPLFIIMHTSFKVQGLVAIAFWSMIAVALSGYLGRYLYQQIPRNMNDKELTLGEIKALLNRFAYEFKQKTGLDDDTVASLFTSFEQAYTVHWSGLAGLIFSLFGADLRRPFIKRRMRRKMRRLQSLPRRDVDELLNLAARQALLKRRVLMLDHINRIFHWWHVIHKPFAIIMYVIMAVHIGVAVWTGFAWF